MRFVVSNILLNVLNYDIKKTYKQKYHNEKKTENKKAEK